MRNGARRFRGDRAAFARHQRRGEVGMVEHEAGHDHHAPQDEHQEHHRDQRALIRAEASKVHDHEGPQECEREPDPDRSGLQRLRSTRPPDRIRDVPDEGDQHVRHHADGDRQPKPLREARHEPPVRTERPAHVDVAAARAGHRRGQARVGEGRQHGGERREEVRGHHVGPDPGHVPLQHDRNHVDRGAQHGADAGRGESQQPELPAESAAGGHGRSDSERTDEVCPEAKSQRPASLRRTMVIAPENEKLPLSPMPISCAK